MLPVHQRESPEQSKRNSPIHLAAARGNIEAVRILMESNVTKNKEPINKRHFILLKKTEPFVNSKQKDLHRGL